MIKIYELYNKKKIADLYYLLLKIFIKEMNYYVNNYRKFNCANFINYNGIFWIFKTKEKIIYPNCTN